MSIRIGYGDVDVLKMIRRATALRQIETREHPSVRIGVIVSDNRTMVFSPVPRNVEAASTNIEQPNALMIEGEAVETLACAFASDRPRTEVGMTELTSEQVDETVKDLTENPPRPFDLSRRLTVFRSEVQYVELTLKKCCASFAQDSIA